MDRMPVLFGTCGEMILATLPLVNVASGNSLSSMFLVVSRSLPSL